MTRLLVLVRPDDVLRNRAGIRVSRHSLPGILMAGRAIGIVKLRAGHLVSAFGGRGRPRISLQDSLPACPMNPGFGPRRRYGHARLRR